MSDLRTDISEFFPSAETAEINLCGILKNIYTENCLGYANNVFLWTNKVHARLH